MFPETCVLNLPDRLLKENQMDCYKFFRGMLTIHSRSRNSNTVDRRRDWRRVATDQDRLPFSTSPGCETSENPVACKKRLTRIPSLVVLGAMFIAYYDESGDDGWPKTSTDTFILSAVYMHHQHWKENFQRMHAFRKELWRSHGFPFSLEFHTREFLLDKDPYRNLEFDGKKRHEILRLFCNIIANLNCRIISVCINKRAIQQDGYEVLDRAFTYSIQRIENDLKSGGSRFLIISDEGRVGKMRKTSRRIQRFNPIQSKFSPSTYRKEIELLVEDPLPKNSAESFFIQAADTVSYLVGLQMRMELGHGGLPNRLAKYMDAAAVQDCLNLLKPSLNLKASLTHPYGVVCYPKINSDSQ